MNIIETYAIDNPYGEQDICPMFTIDDISTPFMFHNITTKGQRYSFRLWVKSDAEGGLRIRNNNIPTTTEWKEYQFTFTATDVNVGIYFDTIGVYYIYHPQLESGNRATDWSKSPLDVDESVQEAQDSANEANQTASNNADRLVDAESLIQQLKDRISMLVTSEDGTTLWEQTPDSGWTFSMAQTLTDIETIRGLVADLEASVGSVDHTVEVLEKSVTGIESSLEWVKITTFEDEPCIALGETDSDFKLLITNTRIVFLQGTDIPAYISNQALNITKAVIKEEMQQGNFVWKVRTNGNMGLLWKGVIS